MTDLLADAVSESWGFWAEWASGEWEPETHRIIAEHLAGGGTYVDFGAWVGPTVLWAVEAGADRIVAYEPDGVAFAMLEANVGRLSGVELHHEAVHGHTGYVHVAQSGNSMSRCGDPNDPMVPCSTIEAAFVAAGVGRPVLIKMDIEGAEVAVLSQAEPFLRRLGSPILLSTHSWAPGALDQLPGWTVEMTLDECEFLVTPPAALPPIPGQELTVNWPEQAA